MKKIVFSIGTLVLASLILISCSKKNGVATTNKLTFQLKSMGNVVSLSPTTSSPSISSALTWQSGFANIANITSDIESKDIEGSESSTESAAAIKKVDLFGQNQLIGNINIAPGTYPNLNVWIEIAQTATEPALYLKGFYTNSAGKKTAIEFSLNEGTVQNDTNNQMQGENHHSDPGQIEIGATAKNLVVGNNSTASITLHLDKLMTGITDADLDAATQTTGVIVIDKTQNPNIYAKIKANIYNSSDIN